MAEGKEITEEKPKNSIGIPEAQFVDDVDQFMAQDENQGNATAVLRRLDEEHSKFKFMELNMLQKKKRLKRQVPEIKSTLDVLKFLSSKKNSSDAIETQFLLTEQVYATAQIPPTNKVCLWLGANVMLEYEIEDAESLLSKNLQTATKALAQLEDDLDFLRDQLTTTEVNMARVYNWDVRKRQSDREKNPPALTA